MYYFKVLFFHLSFFISFMSQSKIYMVVRKIMSMIVQMIMRTCLMVTVFRNNEEKSILEFCAAIKMTAENSLRKERIT